MIEVNEMSREQLLEVIRIKNILIKDLRNEIEIYEQLAKDLQTKLALTNEK